jgi:hypothetical protein
MAYQHANPRPFALPGFQPLEVHHQEIMARVVVHHSPASHEDFAIVSITPLPTHAMQFGVVQEVIHEFLEEHLHVDIREIQPSHLGQGHVHFVNAHDTHITSILLSLQFLRSHPNQPVWFELASSVMSCLYDKIWSLVLA